MDNNKSLINDINFKDKSFTNIDQSLNSGHYSLFSGYQEFIDKNVGTSLDEIKRNSKLKINSKSGNNKETPVVLVNKYINNFSNQLKDNILSVARLIKIEEAKKEKK